MRAVALARLAGARRRPGRGRRSRRSSGRARARIGRWLEPLGAARREGRAPTRRAAPAGARRRRRAAGRRLAASAGPVAGAALRRGRAARRRRGSSRARRRRWRAELARAAPAVARALADALAGGHSVRGALGDGGRGRRAGRRGRRAARGGPRARARRATEDVLERLRARAGAPAWDTLVAAILLQRDAGGDLAGLLRDSPRALEAARARGGRRARATAQARFTAWLVALLPVGAAVLAELATRASSSRCCARRCRRGCSAPRGVLPARRPACSIRRIARVRRA